MEGEEIRRRRKSPHWNDQEYKRSDKSTTYKFKDLDAWVDAINTDINALVTVDALIRQTKPPFTEMVMRIRVSSKFKLPSQLGVYKRKMNPMDHLDSYKNLMMV